MHQEPTWLRTLREQRRALEDRAAAMNRLNTWQEEAQAHRKKIIELGELPIA